MLDFASKIKEMGNKKITLTEERHDKIYKVYEEVVRKYGEMARFMNKTHFYHETAAIVSLSHYTIQKIVNKRLKGKKAKKLESSGNHRKE